MVGEKKTKNNTNCCVPQCHSKASREKNLSFHRFPLESDKCIIINSYNEKEKVKRRKEWLRCFKIRKKISNRMLVCSKHFRNEDFFSCPGRLGKARQRARLKQTAVPTLFLPLSSTDVKNKIDVKKDAAHERQERYNSRIRFLHNQPSLKKRILAVRRKDLKPSKCIRLCNKHFTKEDYDPSHSQKVEKQQSENRQHAKNPSPLTSTQSNLKKSRPTCRSMKSKKALKLLSVSKAVFNNKTSQEETKYSSKLTIIHLVPAKD